MSVDITVRKMTQNDENQVKQIIDLSFPIIYRFFAAHSLHEDGQVLVADTQGSVVGFAKLINFQIDGKKYGCILWIAVHPNYRRKHIAVTLTNNGTLYLKQNGANAVFASTQKRNTGALSVLKKEGFRTMGFLVCSGFSVGWFSRFTDLFGLPLAKSL